MSGRGGARTGAGRKPQNPKWKRKYLALVCSKEEYGKIVKHLSTRERVETLLKKIEGGSR